MIEIMFAFLLTMAAGLSTGIGSIIAFFAKKTNKKFLSISLGFSAGVMIYVSLRDWWKMINALSLKIKENIKSSLIFIKII